MNSYPYLPYPGSLYPQNMQQEPNAIIWVQGEAGAKAYHVAPNKSVPLWDSERKTIYVKSADPSGMPSMRILDYEERGERSSQKSEEYATKDDIAALEDKIKVINDKIKGLINE